MVEFLKKGSVGFQPDLLLMEWHFSLRFDLLSCTWSIVFSCIEKNQRSSRRMRGPEPMTWGCSTWNTENWKHTLFHFQILKVHSNGGEFRGKRLGPVGRSYLLQFLLSIRVHYPQRAKAYPWGSAFPFKGCDQAETAWLPVGYSNGLWPVVGKAVPPSQSPQPRQHLEIWRDLLVGWLLQCLGTTGFWVSRFLKILSSSEWVAFCICG